MQMSNRLAGYSLGDADILRRAMGKKKKEEMDKQRERFIKGALALGFPKKKIEKVFDIMAKFAGYGFNKSHSAAYASPDAWLAKLAKVKGSGGVLSESSLRRKMASASSRSRSSLVRDRTDSVSTARRKACCIDFR